ncbi:MULTISPECIES: TRAP transporter substrate-binding protein [unclassified Paenibacillus]|uniref:TRAP transporter substrate-binding protein n=1 Tax=unclassified Paenibacillus TaxID=185978 RepID=UPI001AE195B7|nr:MULTISPECIES: TRAP transporter substrate-binding protein [unclassified Paenibacillus]MBP1157271.1 tripartite ATP-independent transporter DctP family solute receptor [Paenibacillus sp. PvP091]MBP1171990.1 tripartite ATP-independent transporter DctP family solute receptor [Paenibacillus sp. PvR098]MBP2438371.1 tripartite ATP-independent transporter DctP family solute receptor [Paenibacillus sp. PvP052]
MKKIFKTTAIGVIIASLLAACGSGGGESAGGTTDGASGGDSQQKMVLKFANITKEGSGLARTAEKIGEELNAKTNGRITVQLFPGGQLGNETDMMQQLNTGSLDMAIITTAQLSSSSPAFGAWLMPFPVNDHKQAYELWTSPESMALFDTLTNDNVKGLGYASSGFRYFLATKPVVGLADLDRFKLRTTPSPTILDFLTSIKVSPTPMPLTEVYTALQTGVIGGVDIDTESIISEKLTEIAKNMTPSKHMYWAGGILINKDRWNGLSDEDKKLIEEAVSVAMKDNVEYVTKNEDDLIANASTKFGLTTHQLTNKAEFDPYIKAVQDKWIAKSPEIGKFLEKAKEISKE